MVKRIALILTLLFPLLMKAQEAKHPATAGLAFGIFANSFGFGLDTRYMILRSDWDYHIGLSFGSYKHPKESKIESAYADQGGKDYVYDKLNYGYLIAPTFSISRKIIRLGSANRIGLNMSLGGGPLFCLLKPYYLEIAVPFSGNQALVEVHKYDPSQYNYTNIYGSADYFLGMNELSMVPGARIKLGSMVDFSSGSSYIRAFEMGIFADIFSKPLPLLGNNPNRNFFFGGSVELLIGNMW
jgi:hypothetical protein